MPTKLDRVQVLFNKELFHKLKLIAKVERRSLSKMVSSIVEDSIESPKYKSLLSRAKANNLNSKINEGKLLIKDILKPNISNELDLTLNSKLKQIEDILTLISDSNQELLGKTNQGLSEKINQESWGKTNQELSEKTNQESFEEDLLLVEKALKPDGLIEELELETDYKINKMKGMLNKIKKNKDLNV